MKEFLRNTINALIFLSKMLLDWTTHLKNISDEKLKEMQTKEQSWLLGAYG